MPNKQDIEQQLAQLREEFADSLSQRVNKIIADLELLATNTDIAASLHEVFRQIHSLSGSSGSFGFRRLSEHCCQLELILRESIKQNVTPDGKAIDYLRHGLQQLHELISMGPDIMPDDEMSSQSATPSHSEDAPLSSQGESQRLVFIVEDDESLGQSLCVQLTYYGFTTQLFSHAADALTALKQTRPDVMLLDIILPEGTSAGISLAMEVSALLNESLPCLFISSGDDWAPRLAAVRAGGRGYLKKPLDIAILADHLDRLTQRQQSEPYRVLVVDDALELAQHYALVLRQADMHAETLTEPSQILDKLERFKPELILLDFYFPDITGIEIATVVRQHQNYSSIPIVFLSTETDRDTQLKTLRQGDDFLVKPITDAQLVSVVETRINRAREFGQLMYHDGMTGLLNQITLKRRLEIELARCRRQGYPLCYAMIDLDYFKQVNDRYGHATGDKVLKSLAQLLKERLRKSDQIGRYGGEEFGIILPDTRHDMAVQIVDDLRKRFSQLSFQYDGADFTCSFSAGIACTAEFDEEQQLLEAADKALYQAKKNGRNQVQLASGCAQ